MEIEYERIIIMIVIKTDAEITELAQSTLPNWAIIKKPTITKAAAVTEGVNNANISGAINIESKNKIPVTTADKPVFIKKF